MSWNFLSLQILKISSDDANDELNKDTEGQANISKDTENQANTNTDTEDHSDTTKDNAEKSDDRSNFESKEISTQDKLEGDLHDASKENPTDENTTLSEQDVPEIRGESANQRPVSLRGIVQAKFIRRGWRKLNEGRIEDTPTGWRLVR